MGAAMSGDADCIVVGAGLAGLACARTLVRAGRQVLVVEAADRVGGRVATDTVDGFRIDRGFQVYLDAYPEGRRQLDLAALGLGCLRRQDRSALRQEVRESPVVALRHACIVHVLERPGLATGLFSFRAQKKKAATGATFFG